MALEDTTKPTTATAAATTTKMARIFVHIPTNVYASHCVACCSYEDTLSPHLAGLNPSHSIKL